MKMVQSRVKWRGGGRFIIIHIPTLESIIKVSFSRKKEMGIFKTSVMLQTDEVS
jgi:hypothetical protein